jgi:hypothetical protein
MVRSYGLVTLDTENARGDLGSVATKYATEVSEILVTRSAGVDGLMGYLLNTPLHSTVLHNR